jgi:hypothetical protein
VAHKLCACTAFRPLSGTDALYIRINACIAFRPLSGPEGRAIRPLSGTDVLSVPTHQSHRLDTYANIAFFFPFQKHRQWWQRVRCWW